MDGHGSGCSYWIGMRFCIVGLGGENRFSLFFFGGPLFEIFFLFCLGRVTSWFFAVTLGRISGQGLRRNVAAQLLFRKYPYNTGRGLSYRDQVISTRIRFRRLILNFTKGTFSDRIRAVSRIWGFIRTKCLSSVYFVVCRVKIKFSNNDCYFVHVSFLCFCVGRATISTHTNKGNRKRDHFSSFCNFRDCYVSRTRPQSRINMNSTLKDGNL